MANVNVRQTLQTIRSHVSQRHSCKSVDVLDSYWCVLCGMGGFGRRLYCSTCRLAFHHLCFLNPVTPRCFLHPGQHKMSRTLHHPGTHDCFLCCEKVGLLSYHCSSSNVWAHPVCFHLRQRVDGDGDKKTITHFLHPHHLLRDTCIFWRYKCDGCRSVGFGRRFRCDLCNFDLHPYCATYPNDEQCLVHPAHKMVIRPSEMSYQLRPYICIVCKHPITRTDDPRPGGLHYGCLEPIAHPLCAQLQTHKKGAGRSMTEAARKLWVSGIRSALLHSIGIPDLAGAWDAFEGLCTIWEIASGASEVAGVFSDASTLLAELDILLCCTSGAT